MKKNRNPQATTKQVWGSNIIFPKQLEPEPKKTCRKSAILSLCEKIYMKVYIVMNDVSGLVEPSVEGCFSIRNFYWFC